MSKTGCLAIAITYLFACGSDATKQDAGTGGDGRHADGRPLDSAAKVFMDGPPGTTPLMVKNYLAWCTVTVDSGSGSGSAVQRYDVTPGVIPLSATPNAMFELGATPWHDTDNDTGTGDPGTRNGSAADTTITVGATPACVWVCCETIGVNDCPTIDICP